MFFGLVFTLPSGLSCVGGDILSNLLCGLDQRWGKNEAHTSGGGPCVRRHTSWLSRFSVVRHKQLVPPSGFHTSYCRPVPLSSHCLRCCAALLLCNSAESSALIHPVPPACRTSHRQTAGAAFSHCQIHRVKFALCRVVV